MTHETTDTKFYPRVCPWCGANPEVEFEGPLDPRIDDSDGGFTVLCRNSKECLSFRLFRDVEEAIRAWNTRATDAEIERLKSIERKFNKLESYIESKIVLFGHCMNLNTLEDGTFLCIDDKNRMRYEQSEFKQLLEGLNND